MSLRVGVLDYGSGNLHSVCRALSSAGADVVLSSQAADLNATSGLVVPGVGAFAACMAGLIAVGGDDLIRSWVGQSRPLLGICVGHQVLFERGVEHGLDIPGVGLLGGVVEPLRAKRLPHMGWNLVEPPAGSVAFDGVSDQRFYFVHSYGVHGCTSPNAQLTWASHGGDRFVAALEAGPITTTQFHPEKSGVAGARLLRNWLATL